MSALSLVVQHYSKAAAVVAVAKTVALVLAVLPLVVLVVLVHLVAQQQQQTQPQAAAVEQAHQVAQVAQALFMSGLRFNYGRTILRTNRRKQCCNKCSCCNNRIYGSKS
jgi:Na+/phosphate symporter